MPKSKAAWLTIAAVVLGVIILLGFGTLPTSPKEWLPPWRTPSMSDIANWSTRFWLPILMVSGIISLFIAKMELGKTAQVVLGSIVAGLLVVAPVFAWITAPSTKAPVVARTKVEAPRALPADTINLPWAWRMDQSEWPRLEVAPHCGFGSCASYLRRACGVGRQWVHSPLRMCRRSRLAAWRRKQCPDGGVEFAYVRNEGDETLYVSYAYARANEQ